MGRFSSGRADQLHRLGDREGGGAGGVHQGGALQGRGGLELRAQPVHQGECQDPVNY